MLYITGLACYCVPRKLHYTDKDWTGRIWLYYKEFNMKERVSTFSVIVLMVLLGSVPMHGREEKKPFAGESLPNEWTWKRPNLEAWRLRDGGLEIKI
jgi:hypothetical protein